MSVRLTLLNIGLRTAVRPMLRRTKSPDRARRDFAMTARLLFRGPRREAVRGVFGGRPALEIRPGGAPVDAAILYFHGGGYVAGSPETHLPMLGALARRCNLRAVLPDYRLAPEAPCPAAFDDACAAWRDLRAETGRPDTILLGGDSAGGGLALALLAHLVREGEVPAGCFAFSPWTDMTASGPSLDENAARDPILPVSRIRDLTSLVLGETRPDDPRASPLFADFTGAPPVYFQVSASEILRDDTLRLADRLREQGVDVKTDIWPDVPHVWQMFNGWLPEADEALDRAAAFASARISAARRESGS